MGFLRILSLREEVPPLVTIQVVLVALAFEFEQFILVLIGVAFSTWVVLPWAFYDRLYADSKLTDDLPRAERAKSRLESLRTSQGFLFMSGVLFMFFFGADYLLSLPSLDPFLSNVLPLAETLLLIFGLVMLFSGLADAFRVVNYFSGARPTESRDLLKLTVSPFLIFNAILIYGYATSLSISGIRYHSFFGVFFIFLWFGLLMASLISLKWLNHLFSAERSNPKAVFVVLTLILPYISVFVYYYLITHGFG